MLDVRIVRKYQTDYPEVMDAINKVFLNKAGKIVLADAQRNAPVDSGILKGSLNSQVDLPNAQVRVGTDVNYSIYVEYGTRHMKAQPYLRPALDDNRRDLVQEWRRSFRAVFRALGRL